MSHATFPEIAGELDEETLSRIKTELDPGERLLWAVRPRSKPVAMSWGVSTAGLLSASFVLLGFVFMRLSFHPGLAPNEKPLVLGVICWVLACFIVGGMIVNRRERDTQDSRLDKSLYALTDRRAISWFPSIKRGALEIVSIHKGECLRLSRVEYPDGTGDVLFRSRVKGEYEDFDQHEFAGFPGVQDVRRVEELVRRTLFSEVET